MDVDIWSLRSGTPPRVFFEEALAGWLEDGPPVQGAAPGAIEFFVEDPDPQGWALAVRDSRLCVLALRDGPLEDTVLRVCTARETFDAWALGAVRDRWIEALGGLAAARERLAPRRLAAWLPHGARAAALRSLEGVIALEIVDEDEGQSHEFRLVLPAGGRFESPRRVELCVDLDEALDVLAGRRALRAALFGGRVEVRGDVSLPLSVLTALGA